MYYPKEIGRRMDLKEYKGFDFIYDNVNEYHV